MKQLEGLASELAGLPSSLIDRLPCSGEIRNLFHETASMKGGARKRHVKYITRLLKDEPVDELYAFLSEKKGRALQEKKQLLETEFLRDALLSEAIAQQREAESNQKELEENWPSRIADNICGEFPEIEKTLLTRLAWLYARTRNRRHSRELFRLLRSASEQKRLLKKNQ